MVANTPQDVIDKVEDFVREKTRENFGDRLDLTDVCVVAHEDQFGDERMFIYMVYDGHPDDVDLDWTVRIIGMIQDAFPKSAIPEMPMTEIIRKSEWPRLYKHNVAPWKATTI